MRQLLLVLLGQRRSVRRGVQVALGALVVLLRLLQLLLLLKQRRSIRRGGKAAVILPYGGRMACLTVAALVALLRLLSRMLL